jgi:hypothetical protein
MGHGDGRPRATVRERERVSARGSAAAVAGGGGRRDEGERGQALDVNFAPVGEWTGRDSREKSKGKNGCFRAE